MTLDYLNPDSLAKPFGYTQIVRTKGSTTVYISGQVGIDADGQIVGQGDFQKQARQAFDNLKTALASVGAGPDQVAKITTFVVDYSPDLRAPLHEIRTAIFGSNPPASTLLGVQALATPDFLIEVEAIAVLD